MIAQQLLVLREARLEDSASVLFEGRTIPLKEHHVIVTMNPGYAGRTELPDNLKVSLGLCYKCLSQPIHDFYGTATILCFLHMA